MMTKMCLYLGMPKSSEDDRPCAEATIGSAVPASTAHAAASLVIRLSRIAVFLLLACAYYGTRRVFPLGGAITTRAVQDTLRRHRRRHRPARLSEDQERNPV